MISIFTVNPLIPTPKIERQNANRIVFYGYLGYLMSPILPYSDTQADFDFYRSFWIPPQASPDFITQGGVK